MSKKVIIVGGVAGGASAAARMRRLDEKAEIILFERGEYISFANCGLPYYIGGDIKDRSRLLVQTPEAMQSRFNLDVRIKSEVISINALRRTVTVRQSNGEEYEESFDALLLSPGAKPIKPSIPGIDSERIFTLRSLPDTDRIKSHIEDHRVKRAAVIGGGFIGIEMAENLIQRGIEVTIIEAAPHILAPFDSDMAVYAEQELEDKGARLVLGDSVESFEAVSNEVHLQLKSGRKIASDMVILAIGVTPDTSFLRESGIEMGARGHIVVNERMETNIPGIYAVGDAVEVNHFVLGNQTAIPLAGPANKQGRIAADNIAGLTSQYHGTQGTSILKIFGMTAAATGVNVRTLKRNGQTPHVAFIHPASHATYYPGASSITLKLIFNDEGRILGAQAFGKEGVDKRIDVIATVMRLKGTVQDLSELELSYAPPFSSAKDPVNMAGYVAQNILDGRTDVWLSDELDDLEIQDTQLVDVRTEDEHSVGAIPGSINIPVDELRERLHELNPSKPVYTYCQVGMRGYIASQILTQNGFKVRNLSGGYKSYKANQFKAVR
ncbi:FAD-dependent oxidoreductase [Paenibacillus agaridevorans]|uniref:FAD-dependent oxidoreductase n=1 Tax=Paenibacillus agaridevorans TaxID=171404 RepID=UPI001BE48002|nr:FAD-dependent oxidoreductase [Paenibacillus agaridevorans]